MHALRTKVNNAIDELLDSECDRELVAEFRKFLYPLDPSYGSEVDYNKDDIATILSNILAFYESIPENSPIRTRLSTLYSMIYLRLYSDFLNIDVSAVYT